MQLVFSVRAADAAPCAPFKVHRQVTLPPAPTIRVPTVLAKDWETGVVKLIGAVKTQEAFPKIYWRWLADHPAELTKSERYAWLRCLDYYVHLDTDGDGNPDWSAISDEQPARVLFPQDPDQDGDGIPNIFDPEPLVAGGTPGAAGIPTHLLINPLERPQEALLQSKLFERFGIIAIDHTDEHAATVLRELLYLLENGFDRGAIASLSGWRYVYAFAGHDPRHRVAAFHRQARALSVGGRSAYSSGDLPLSERFELLSTLAHEIGHAVLFEKLSAQDLSRTAARFAGWPSAVSIGRDLSLFSRFFFKPFAGLQKDNMVSQYATTNVHEWFAESFAAHTMLKLAKQGSFGKNWEMLFARRAGGISGGWTEYRNLSAAYRRWLSSAF